MPFGFTVCNSTAAMYYAFSPLVFVFMRWCSCAFNPAQRYYKKRKAESKKRKNYLLFIKKGKTMDYGLWIMNYYSYLCGGIDAVYVKD